jgi:hypothetical protein
MLAFLPIPGALFTLANRALNPALVLSQLESFVLTDRAFRLVGFIGLATLWTFPST